MKSLILGFALMCISASGNTALAGDSDTDVLSGRVQAIYVRLNAGVFREAPAGYKQTEVWAEVKTYDLPGYRERGATVMIRTQVAVERGDIVSFRRADETMIPIAPMPAESRILAITAKRGSAVALLYGSASAETAF
jgi:hypothetical protein